MGDKVPTSLASIFSAPTTYELQQTQANSGSKPFGSDGGSQNQQNKGYGYEQTIFGSFHQEMARKAKDLLEMKLEGDQDEIVMDPIPERYEGDSRIGKWIWYWNRLMDKINDMEQVVAFLVIVSFVTAALACFVDIVVYYLAAGRTYLVAATGNFWLGYMVYVLHTLVFVSLALFFTHTIAPNAAGSGLPEMKCILSGLTLAKYLSRKTLVAKVLGVTCGIGSGIIAGRQGPFVHVASCIVNLFSYARCFRNLATNPTLRMQLLAAACAVGVSVAYGAPIGGVLYSIEVTSTYYPIRYYWAAFISSIVSGFAFRALWNIFLGQSYLLPIVPTNFSLGNLYMEWYEWCILIIMSLLGCMMGVAFIQLNAWAVSFRRQYAKQFPVLGPFHFTLLVAGTTAVLFYPPLFGTYMGLGNMAAVKDLFADRTLIAYGSLNGDWTPYSIFLSLFLFFTIRFILGTVSASVAIPIGSYAPSLAIGAALGRFFGEIIHVLWPTSISPAVYAVIGCCAFAGSITQTISTAVILLEITGDLNFICPALVAVIISVGISKKVTVNIYDSMLIIRRLPFLPDLKRRSYVQTAKDFMRTDVPALPLKTSLKEMKELLEKYVSRGQNFRNINIPIVEDKGQLFIGSTRFETFYSLYNQLKTELRNKRSEVAMLTHQTESEFDAINVDAIRFDLRPRLKAILYGNPIQCVPDTPIATVHIMFATLHLMNVFVVKNGRLIGVITRSALKKALKG